MNRHPAGVPAGGQFAAGSNAEPSTTLESPGEAGWRSCHQCGGDFRVDPWGVAEHLDGDGDIDYDANADHAPFELDDPEELGAWETFDNLADALADPTEQGALTEHDWADTLPESTGLLWETAGFDPATAEPWLERGFSAGEAQSWRASDFGYSEASQWRRFVDNPPEAARWKQARFSPSDAYGWIAAGRTPEQANVEMSGLDHRSG